MKIICKLCKKEVGHQGIGWHIKTQHQISYNQYVEKFIEDFPEDFPNWYKCRTCGKLIKGHKSCMENYLKSKCCNEGISRYQTENIGTWKCNKCGEQCGIKEYKLRDERFIQAIQLRIELLDYYEADEKKGSENFGKIQGLEEALKHWENFYCA